jgi:Spy/CpxP family protein refolding chaperone
MNARVVTLLFSIIGLIQPLAAAAPLKVNDDGLSQMNTVLASVQTKDAVADVLSQDAVIPRGPADVIKDYENQMGALSRWLTEQLGSIAQAVESGELTREQGKYFSGERYQLAMMQFQFLRTQHAILEHEIAATSAASKDPAPDQRGQAVVLALPFSSLQLDPSLAQYLELNPQQLSAIQGLMSRERTEIEPLMAQFRTTQQELLATTQSSQSRDQSNDKKIRSLADAQAHLLTKLIATNWRLQTDLSELLSPEQRKKLDVVKRSRELSVQ